MAFFGASLDLGIAIFFVAALAEYAKLRARIEKPLAFLAAGGAFFILHAAFETFSWPGVNLSVLLRLFNTVGVLFALVGSILAAYKLVTEK